MFVCLLSGNFWKFEKVRAKTLSRNRAHSSTLAEMSSAFLPQDYTTNHISLWSQIETEPFSDSIVELMAVEFDVVWVSRKLGFSAWVTHGREHGGVAASGPMSAQESSRKSPGVSSNSTLKEYPLPQGPDCSLITVRYPVCSSRHEISFLHLRPIRVTPTGIIEPTLPTSGNFSDVLQAK